MTNNRTILITGVTGKQGGAVAQSLQGAGFHLRGLTRKPDSPRAAALARHGVEIVKGDLDDEATQDVVEQPDMIFVEVRCAVDEQIGDALDGRRALVLRAVLNDVFKLGNQ